jgi:transcriptional regulator with XRE-family HTH domain
MPRTAHSATRNRTDAETLGQRLARLRKERGFTQVELAEKAGTIQAVISSYERGRVRPHGAMIGTLAQALGVSADELLGLAEAQTPKANGFSRRVLRRMQLLEGFPAHDQKAVFKMIDALAAQHAGKRAG